MTWQEFEINHLVWHSWVYAKGRIYEYPQKFQNLSFTLWHQSLRVIGRIPTQLVFDLYWLKKVTRIKIDNHLFWWNTWQPVLISPLYSYCFEWQKTPPETVLSGLLLKVFPQSDWKSCQTKYRSERLNKVALIIDYKLIKNLVIHFYEEGTATFEFSEFQIGSQLMFRNRLTVLLFFLLKRIWFDFL